MQTKWYHPRSQATRSLNLSGVEGAKGLLAEEEERLFKLRQEIEGEARQELDRARAELEEQGRTSQVGKLCATPFGVDVVGITEFIALTGALVGGKLYSLQLTHLNSSNSLPKRKDSLSL